MVESKDFWSVVHWVDSMVVLSVDWMVFVMAAKMAVMMVVLSAGEKDARMVASKGAWKAEMMVDSKVDWKVRSTVGRLVVVTAVDSES